MAQIVLHDLGVRSVSLRLVIIIAWLFLMMVSRNNFGEGVLLLESTVHVPWLVPLIVIISVIHRKFKLWRFHVIVTIRHRISLPILGNFRFVQYMILVIIKLIDVCPFPMSLRGWLFPMGLWTLIVRLRQHIIIEANALRLVHSIRPRREYWSALVTLLVVTPS